MKNLKKWIIILSILVIIIIAVLVFILFFSKNSAKINRLSVNLTAD